MENQTIISEPKSSIAQLEEKIGQLSSSFRQYLEKLKETYDWKDVVTTHPVLSGFSAAFLGYFLGRKKGRVLKIGRSLFRFLSPVILGIVQDVLMEKLQEVLVPVLDEAIDPDCQDEDEYAE